MLFPATFLFLLLSPAIVNAFQCQPSVPDGYDATAPAAKNLIQTFIGILDIQKVDDLDMSYTITLLLRFTWNDPRLANYTVIDKSGVKMANHSCVMGAVPYEDRRKFWLPNFYIYDTFDGMGFLDRDQDSAGDVFVGREHGVVTQVTEVSKQIKCYMRFTNYPMDQQFCQLKIGSGIQSARSLSFNTTWFAMPEVAAKSLQFSWSFSDLDPSQTISYSQLPVTGFNIRFSRSLYQFGLNVYVPTGLMVMISTASFIIPVTLVPGRMALLVTMFLMLINISNSERAIGPKSESMTAMDVWLVACITFVASALLEYAFLLKVTYNPWLYKCKESQEKRDKLCLKIDRFTFVLYPVAFVVFSFIYNVDFLIMPQSDSKHLHLNNASALPAFFLETVL